jgi:transposase InsO family protein
VAAEFHRRQGHCSAGLSIRELSKRWWHPELALAIYDAVLRCPQCQLMKKPDPTPQGLTPITPSEPLTRWGIDHTGPIEHSQLVKKHMLNAIEYATGWAECFWVEDITGGTTLAYMDQIRTRFGPIKEMISDNGTAFVNHLSEAWFERHGIRHLRSTPAHPRTNGRVERFNGVIKEILNKTRLDDPGMSMEAALQHSTYIYNRRPGLHGYSPYYLMYGVVPADQTQYLTQPYIREPSEAEEIAFGRDLVRNQHASTERQYVASLKASRDVIRARLQESKAHHRIYTTGDWVLRVRKREHKHEPYYDGPWLVRACHTNNTYTLASPGGIELESRYNGELLYPAYVTDGHPERSFWYANKTLLKKDRRRQLELLGEEEQESEPSAPNKARNGTEGQVKSGAPNASSAAPRKYDDRRFTLRE